MSYFIPEFRKYKDGEKEFYMSGMPVLVEDGKSVYPKAFISRWDAESLLRQIENRSMESSHVIVDPSPFGLEGAALNTPEGSFSLPNLYHSHIVAKCDPNALVLDFPAEWQSTLILNPNAPTETFGYVIMDEQERVIEPADRPRSLEPIRKYLEGGRRFGGRQIVVAKVFDVPFRLENSRYDPEDIDPETGFMRRLNPKGKYQVLFDKDDGLHPTSLRPSGLVYCKLEPTDAGLKIGFRAFSLKPASNLPIRSGVGHK